MWKLEKLTLSNVFGFKSVEIDFPEDGSYLILGENKDDPGSRSNDAGKSALFDSIMWVLTGEYPRRRTSVSDIVFRGADKAEGRLVIRDGEKQIELYRRRNSSGSKDFHFTGENSDYNEGQRQQQFESRFGVKGAFLHYLMQVCYFNFAQVKAFADPDMTSRERLQLLEQMFGVERLSKAKAVCSSRRQDYKKELDSLYRERATLDEVLGQLVIMSDKEREELEKEKQAVLDRGFELKDKKEKYEKELESWRVYYREKEQYEANVLVLRSRISEIESSIETLSRKLEKRQSIEDEIRNHKSVPRPDVDLEQFMANRHKLVSAIHEIELQINELKSKLAVSGKALECPGCRMKLKYDSGVLIEVKGEINTEHIKKEIEAKVTEKQRTQEKLAQLSQKEEEAKKAWNDYEEDQNKISKLRLVLDTFDDIQIEYKNAKARLESSKAELASVIENWESREAQLKPESSRGEDELKAEIQKISTEMLRLRGRYEEIKIKLETDETNKEKRKKFEQDLRRIRSEITNKKKDLDRYSILEQVFPRVRNILLDRAIPRLESRANWFLSEMGTDVRVGFDMDLGKTRGEFSLNIIDNGEVWPYDMRGRGKRTRIAICTGLANRELYIHAAASAFGFLFLDEVVDHMDDVGVSQFFSLLERHIPGQRFVISHNEAMQSYFGSVLRVEKKGGISNVFWEKL